MTEAIKKYRPKPIWLTWPTWVKENTAESIGIKVGKSGLGCRDRDSEEVVKAIRSVNLHHRVLG